MASINGSTLLYYHDDYLKGTNVLTDSNGTVKELIEYDPYGQMSRHDQYGSSEEIAWFYFTGKKLDAETGLYYYGARYYDSSLGRFITPDTIVPYSNDPQSFNRYSYARNNPINIIDPTGHKWSWKKFWHAFAGAVVGAIVTVATGGLGAPLAFALGGAVGGAITGGLDGGLRGALMGGLMGGVLGGAVGAGVGAFGAGFGYAALAAGGGYAIGTGHADSFVGGLAGGIVGSAIGNGVDSYLHDSLAATDPKGGVRNGDVEGRGVGTTAAKALKVANDTESRVLYTPSRGVAADIVRGGMQMLFGHSLASHQFAQYAVGNPNTIYNFHSEMTLTALGAVKALQAEGTQISAHFNLTSAFYSKATAQSAFNSVGASVNFVPPNLGDLAGVFSNPILSPIYGPASFLTGEYFHGYQTYKHYE